MTRIITDANSGSACAELAGTPLLDGAYYASATPGSTDRHVVEPGETVYLRGALKVVSGGVTHVSLSARFARVERSYLSEPAVQTETVLVGEWQVIAGATSSPRSATG